ncbi:SDR family oxidoreductase [Alkalibacterium sp.]|nr:MAG: SDR family oxidoreductase [Alkalibacterium sp.]
MNVLIVGANGQIGQHLVNELKEGGQHTPVAFVRKEEQVKAFEDKGVEARLGNLEDSIEKISKTMTDIDAVVFTAGSGGGTGYDKTVLIDLDGAVKTVEAAKSRGIDRFIMVGAFRSDNRRQWVKDMKPYFAAKYYADMWLVNSGLNYTIVRPGNLENAESIGTIAAGEATKKAKVYTIPRVDVAKVIAESLENEATHKKAFDLLTGDDNIKDGLDKL